MNELQKNLFNEVKHLVILLFVTLSISIFSMNLFKLILSSKII